MESYGYEDIFKKYEWKPWCVTNISVLDAVYIDNLVRNSKHEIIKEIESGIPVGLKPKYIFVYSSNYETSKSPAGLSIVYANEYILKKSEDSAQSQITAICERVLKRNDRENKYLPSLVQIEFFDANKCNLYGMARED
ncbi:hypothetical protein [Alkaliphilus peptidifermentans]|uniref:Uncharacterized protein n=1 Tax=Alkaliphilus peptidifermentans DSM 18978 TaxID=1120976 RepID=A0A1G5LFN5_9FIRM|nr:hypothetical protein [Alkaliphilus peptidifermentans]SCZ11444.1 hypothetical protein SAMN03080606_04365 [Alkaliphilus peptidifermentans DSM 18978]